MFPNSPNSSGSVYPKRVRPRVHAAFVPPLVLAGCLALSACGSSSSDPSTAASVRRPVHHLSHRERAELVELVGCARHHGIALPEPNAEGKVSTKGLNLKSPRHKAALDACFHKVVTKASREEAAIKRAEGREAEREGAHSGSFPG